MNKKTFYETLDRKLREQGVRSDYVDSNVNQFIEYFKDKTDEEAEREIEKLGDLDRVAARIKRMTDKLILEESSIPVSDIAPDLDKADNDVKIVTDTEDSDEEEEISEKKNRKKETNDSGIRKVGKSGSSDAALKKKTITFRILFIVFLPLILAFILATLAVFAALYFIIAVLIIISVFALALVTIAGTTVTAFGLIFGVVQLLQNLPIGLYECGLTIIFGASALAVGILLYNFAVRLMPFVASKLLVFLKFVFRKYKIIYVYIKKEYMQL